jgi:hypothetical protein
MKYIAIILVLLTYCKREVKEYCGTVVKKEEYYGRFSTGYEVIIKTNSSQFGIVSVSKETSDTLVIGKRYCLYEIYK